MYTLEQKFMASVAVASIMTRYGLDGPGLKSWRKSKTIPVQTPWVPGQ